MRRGVRSALMTEQLSGGTNVLSQLRFYVIIDVIGIDKKLQACRCCSLLADESHLHFAVEFHVRYRYIAALRVCIQ
jgi:hypothetical protein